MSEVEHASAFPEGGRRIVLFAASGHEGAVDDASRFALSALRPFAQRLVLAADGLTAAGRRSLSDLVDDIIDVPNGTRGFWTHQLVLEELGQELRQADEVVLTGDGWFGPARPLEPVIDRMAGRYVDMWSITDRRDPRGSSGEGGDGVLRLSPYWIAVRRRVLASRAWRRYWATLPARPDLGWQARMVEARLSDAMRAAGYRLAAAFTSDDYPAEHADMFNADLLLQDGCPCVSREVFDGYPLFFDQHAIIGRRIAALMASGGYPVELLWRNLARTLAPKTLHTNAAMLEVLPEVTLGSPQGPQNVLAVVHVPRLHGAEETLARLAYIPGLAHVAVTVADEAFRAAIDRAWNAVRPSATIGFEIRSAPGRDTPDTVVVFEECGDLTFSGRFDVVVALHTGVPPGLVRNAQHYFRRQQVESLLGGPGYVKNVLALFAREPGLGLVFPSTPHIGMSTMGDGWGGHRDGVERVLERLRIDVPRDWASPHAPIGGMWIGRPVALGLLREIHWGTGVETSEIHRRVHAYAAGQLGYHTRTVATAEHAALSHDSLEYTTDHMSMTLYGYPAGYTSMLHRAGPVGAGQGRDFARMYLRFRRPRAWAVVSRVGRALKRLRVPGVGR